MYSKICPRREGKHEYEQYKICQVGNCNEIQSKICNTHNSELFRTCNEVSFRAMLVEGSRVHMCTLNQNPHSCKTTETRSQQLQQDTEQSRRHPYCSQSSKPSANKNHNQQYREQEFINWQNVHEEVQIQSGGSSAVDLHFLLFYKIHFELI